MDYPNDYIEKQDDVVKRNFENFIRGLNNAINVKRIAYIIKMCKNARKILDVGSGGYLPFITGANYAIDISPLAGDLLARIGWKGEFKVADCTAIPYPDKYFDFAYCTEVIEHLPTLDHVKKTISELDRVAITWLITTPAASEFGKRDRWNTEPDHRLFIDIDTLYKLVKPYNAVVWKEDLTLYAVKYAKKTRTEINI